MKSYKCPQCGLVCWKTATACIRCNAPNPFLGQSYSDVDTARAAFAASEVNSPRHNVVRDYASLPTSHARSIFGAAPTSNLNNGYIQNLSQNLLDAVGSALRSVMPRKTNLTELEEAKKNIRWAWKAGRIDISLCVGFIVQYFVWNPSPIMPSAPARVMALLFVIVYLSIRIPLIYGIYRKNRICAIIVFALQFYSFWFCIHIFALSLNFLTLGLNLLTLAFLPYLCLFGYFYLLGFIGTLEYHRLTKP